MAFAKPKNPSDAHTHISDTTKGAAKISSPKNTPKSGSGLPEVPICPDCKEEMAVVLSVPVPHAAGFEDVFYQCPTCHIEVKRTAIPL